MYSWFLLVLEVEANLYAWQRTLPSTDHLCWWTSDFDVEPSFFYTLHARTYVNVEKKLDTLIVESCPFTMVTIWKTISKFPENWIIFIPSDVNTILRSFGRVLFWSCVILLNVDCWFCLLFPWSLCLYRAFRWNWYLLLQRASSWRTRKEWLICLTLHAHLCWWWNCRLLWFL